jgi:hypothetical protein
MSGFSTLSVGASPWASGDKATAASPRRIAGRLNDMGVMKGNFKYSRSRTPNEWLNMMRRFNLSHTLPPV